MTDSKLKQFRESENTARQRKGQLSHSLLTGAAIIVAKNPSQKPEVVRGSANRNVNSAPCNRYTGKRIVDQTSPIVKQIVVGKMKMPKRRVNPELVCVNPAQLPLEGVLTACGLSRAFTKAP